jgi:hypothetical protein
LASDLCVLSEQPYLLELLYRLPQLLPLLRRGLSFQLGPPEKDAVVAAQQRWLIASL